MNAYLGSEKLKQQMVKEMKAHMKMDKVIQGAYESDRGFCAVGCALDSLNHINKKESSHSDHSRYETELGIPRQIARLEDRIFEGLSKEESKTFPLRFLEAVNVGADLSLIMPKFFVWLLGDENDGVIKFAKGYKQSEKAIKGVLKLYQQTVGGKVIKKEKWLEAKNTAAYAAADAAYAAAAAAYAAAATAAYAADAADATAAYADAYAYAAAATAAYADAAYAAADAAADAARRTHYTKMANKLIEILQESK